MSVIKNPNGIDVPDLYENLEAKKGGLIDPRLGTTDNNNYCATCGLNTEYCPGHFGHIKLVDYIFHMGYLDHIKKILDVICLNCSKLLIDINEPVVQNILKY